MRWSRSRVRWPGVCGAPARRSRCMCGAGRWPDLPGNGVTIVGSRASSAYGQRVAGEMAHELAYRGLTVISGAAFGIDTAAHRAALQAARSDSGGDGVRRVRSGCAAGDGGGVGLRDRPGVSGGEPGAAGCDRRGGGGGQ